jgi:hypothetical protein
VDVSTCDRALRVAEKSGDRRLRETEVVGHAGVAVPKHMWCDASERRTRDDLVPVLGELTRGFPSSVPTNTGPVGCSGRRAVSSSIAGSPTGRTDAPSLLSVRRMQLLSISTSGQMRLTISTRRQPVRAIVLAITAAVAS